MHIDYFRDLTIVSVIIRLTLATLFGGIIGLERGMKNRAAGFKTHILVCIGSTLTMLTNQYIIAFMNADADPSRLGAQVISGIGFLGAGTILVTGKQQIKGLTTAAGLWASACMGLAIGVGFYEGAIIGCAFIYGVLTIFNKFDRHILSKSKFVDLYIEFESSRHFKHFLEYLRTNNLKVIYVETNKSNPVSSDILGCFITIQQEKKKEHFHLIQMLNSLDGINFIEEV